MTDAWESFRKSEQMWSRINGTTGPLAAFLRVKPWHSQFGESGLTTASTLDTSNITKLLAETYSTKVIDLTSGIGSSAFLPQFFALGEVATAGPLAQLTDTVDRYNRGVITDALATYKVSDTVSSLIARSTESDMFASKFETPAALAGIATVASGQATPFLDTSNLLSSLAARIKAATTSPMIGAGFADQLGIASTAAFAAADGDLTRFASGFSLASAILPKHDWQSIFDQQSRIADILRTYGIDDDVAEAAIVQADAEAAGAVLRQLFAGLADQLRAGTISLESAVRLYDAIQFAFFIMQIVSITTGYQFYAPWVDQTPAQIVQHIDIDVDVHTYGCAPAESGGTASTAPGPNAMADAAALAAGPDDGAMADAARIAGEEP